MFWTFNVVNPVYVFKGEDVYMVENIGSYKSRPR